MTVESDVAADGTIDRYELNLNTLTTVYGLLNQAAEDDGYDSLAAERSRCLHQHARLRREGRTYGRVDTGFGVVPAVAAVLLVVTRLTVAIARRH